VRTRPIPRASLVDACSDDRLLGGSVELWPKQREWLAAIAAGPRIHVLAAGRRSSKTTIGALVGVWSCTLRPELREYLRPGERGYACGVATSLRQARLFVAAARSIVERSPLLGALVESISDDQIAFTTGHSLVAFPCTARSGRGWAIHTLLLDEFAHHVTADGDSAAAEVWRALVPSSAQFQQAGRVVVASTPAGSSGLFSDLFARALSGELADARAYRATTQEANPTITAEFLATERIALGEEGFRSEYEASFEGGLGLFFSDDELREVTRKREGEILREDGRSWLLALDPSSGSEDAFAAVLVGRDARSGHEGRLLVGDVYRWQPRRGRRRRLSRHTRAERDLWFDQVLNQVAEIATRFRAGVVSDQHLPGVVQDELRKRGIANVPIRPWTSASKAAAFQSVRARIVSERISLPPHSGLLAEMRRVHRRFRSGGTSSKVEIPRLGDSHGDCAFALALGVYELERAGSGRGARLLDPSGYTIPPVAGIPQGDSPLVSTARREIYGGPMTGAERALARVGIPLWRPEGG
jgi:hypothetical protein